MTSPSQHLQAALNTHRTPALPLDLAARLHDAGWRWLSSPATVAEAIGKTARPDTPREAIWIPYHGPTGAPLLDQAEHYGRLRCYPAWPSRDGRSAKFMARKGSSPHLYLPAGALELATSSGQLILVEGELKAEALALHGLAAVALGGVNAWLGSPERARRQQADGALGGITGGHVGPLVSLPGTGTPLPELDAIPWAQLRRVLISFDSDAASKDQVRAARAELARYVRDVRGVAVAIVELPPELDGGKNGPDDYILRYGPEAYRARLRAAWPFSRASMEDLDAFVGHIEADVHDLSIEQLAARMEPVWEALAGEENDVTVQAWVARLAGTFRGFTKPAIKARIKDFLLAQGADARARRHAEAEASRREAATRIEAGWGLRIPPDAPWSLGPDGVTETRGEKAEVIADRPIWIGAAGLDVATGLHMLLLRWETPDGARVEEWHPRSILADGRQLGSLNGAPFYMGNVPRVSHWLSDCVGYLPDDRRALRLTSSAGWVGDAFILPPDDAAGHVYIGRPIRRGGDLTAWAKGLQLLAQLGPAGYSALAVAGLSAAAPLVRLLGRRNPGLLLCAPSSTGKGSVVAYALSIWAALAADGSSGLLLGADSSLKGIQDAGHQLCDLPIGLDELQRMADDDPKRVESLLYWAGNGPRRTTSSRGQTAKGGERRWGPFIGLAERGLLGGLQTGAQWRAIELTGPPLPPDSEALASQLQALAREHPGAAAAAIVGEILSAPAEWKRDAEEWARGALASHPGLAGEDPYLVALVVSGLSILASVAAVELPVEEIGAWLCSYAAGVRRQVQDKAGMAFDCMVSKVLGMEWAGNCLAWQGEVIAWRSDALGHLDINPVARVVVEALKPFGGAIHAPTWHDRGQLERKAPGHFTVQRRAGNNIVRVWRIPASALPKEEVSDEL